jgi:hypothetical protein
LWTAWQGTEVEKSASHGRYSKAVVFSDKFSNFDMKLVLPPNGYLEVELATKGMAHPCG